MKHGRSNAPYAAFLAVVLLLCLIPSVGMLFWPTTQTTENRAMSPAPQLLTEDGALNVNVFNQFDDWFTDHMAFRNQMISADVRINTALFAESPVSGVVYGTDGWLFYSATLDDYLGNDPLSDRELHALAHNFALVQQWLEDRGIVFLLTIPPNKNTLYGEYMPAWYHATQSDHDAQRLAAFLQEEGVNYLDLFQLFDSHREELYLKQDSHWNAKGAALVYQVIMARLGADYTPVDFRATETVEAVGDLGRMLYGLSAEPEADYDYGVVQRYRFGKEGATVEDGMIVATAPDAANGGVLVFRDSFANTLIPLMANDFSQSVWSKGQPNALERYVQTYEPDYLIIEKVERNIDDYLYEPPIISAPEVTPERLSAALWLCDAEVSVALCENDVTFTEIRGQVTDGSLKTESDIYVSVDGHLYCAFATGETGFVLYLKGDPSAIGNVQVFASLT